MSQFLIDTFTDADNTLIASHVGEVGATWTLVNSASTNPRIKSNRASMGSGGAAMLTASATPGGANYAITSVLFAETATNTSVLHHMARWQDSSNYYYARYNFFNGNWEVCKKIAGVDTTLGSFTDLVTQGNNYTIIFTLNGNALTLNIDGTDRVSVTDGDLTTAGRVGFECFSSSGDDDGFQIDAWFVSDVGVASFNAAWASASNSVIGAGARAA